MAPIARNSSPRPSGSPSLIVFDWDQTLWNSWDFHLKRIRGTADAIGAEPPSDQEVSSSFVVPFVRHVSHLFPTNASEAMNTYMDIYLSDIGNSGRLFPGVPEFLASLKDAGYLLALFSDKRQKYGRMELEIAGVGSLFDHVKFLDRRRPYKPNPLGLQQVLNALTIEPGDAMYVGDSPADIQCARRCGTAGTAALWGSLDPEALILESPAHICRSIEELAGVFKL